MYINKAFQEYSRRIIPVIRKTSKEEELARKLDSEIIHLQRKISKELDKYETADYNEERIYTLYERLDEKVKKIKCLKKAVNVSRKN